MLGQPFDNHFSLGLRSQEPQRAKGPQQRTGPLPGTLSSQVNTTHSKLNDFYIFSTSGYVFFSVLIEITFLSVTNVTQPVGETRECGKGENAVLSLSEKLKIFIETDILFS